jgi:hypothetical protein
VIRSLIIATTLSISTMALSGCTWVALAPDADGVRIGASDALDGCRQVGTTKARTKTRVGIFARNEKKVAEELTTLARNDAPELGGNTVVAEGPVSADGVQRFAIYDCPLASGATP